MNPWLRLAAVAVRGWTRLYTAGLPDPLRERRRCEVAADVHEQIEDARRRGDPPAPTGWEVLSRTLRGVSDDVAWRAQVPAGHLRLGLAVIAAAILLFGTGVFTITRGISLRSAADVEPARLAAGAVSRLNRGATPESVLPPAIDAARSSAPFLVILDRQGNVLASSATLDGAAPVPPPGVLAWAAEHHPYKLSWAPRAGVREAAVVTPFSGPTSGYVVAAQPLGDNSARQVTLTAYSYGAWLLALAVLAVGVVTVRRRPRPVISAG